MSTAFAKPTKPSVSSIRVSPALVQAAVADADTVLRTLDTGTQGLTEAEAQRRLVKYGPNSVAEEAHFRKLMLLGKAIINPLVILLTVLAVVSYFFMDDTRAASVMLGMVVLGVSLRFVQESRADTAAAKLKEMIRVTATVIRDGAEREIPLAATGSRRSGAPGGRRHDSRRCAAPGV